MSFTTQSKFWKLPYFNEHIFHAVNKPPNNPLRVNIACTDPRAWALNQDQRAQFIYELVHVLMCIFVQLFLLLHF